MDTSAATVIVVPGYQDSDPGHWQSLWCEAHPEYVRVTGLDWDHPKCGDWIAALDGAVESASERVVFVAHSLGSVAVACWAASAPNVARRSVRAALLVAPCDTERADFPTEISGFAPMPATRLPFESVVVTSTNDPWIELGRARDVAIAWGSRLVDLGEAGHINVAAGYGRWPEGERLLADLLPRRSSGIIRE